VGSRRKARELALQTLYELDFQGSELGDAIVNMRARSEDAELVGRAGGDVDTAAFAERIVVGVMERREAIDALLGECSTNWKVARMAVVDRNILRMATFELRWMDDIPPKVTLNEAIEIAKRYGSEDSGAFINGILDRIASLKGR
jgi:N utilization substance protein B